MRQAIQTRYFGPGNVRGSRIKAFAEAGSVTVSYDYALNASENHLAAAKALASKLQWDGTWVGGALPNSSGYAFVLSPWGLRIGPDRGDSFTVQKQERAA